MYIPHVTHPLVCNSLPFEMGNNNSLIITFSVFVMLLIEKSLILYETKPVPVPIIDLNEAANSWSTVALFKTCMLVKDKYDIQLRIEELRMCKHINCEYFCEKLFLVRHNLNNIL